MQLTPKEQAMLDGAEGPAVQAAMDLLMRYGRALGAERLVETNNVVASISATTPFMRDYARQRGGMDAVFSEFSLDSDVTVAIPEIKTFTTHVQLGFDPGNAARMGVDEETVRFYKKGEAYITGLGVQATNTCTPYQVGNIPTRGEHCAWIFPIGATTSMPIGAAHTTSNWMCLSNPRPTGACWATGLVSRCRSVFPWWRA
jgi:predicted aconitase